MNILRKYKMIVTVIKPMDVVTIKLSSSEEIVGMFVEKNSTSLKLRKPLSLSMTQNGPALSPYFITGDVMNEASEVEFNISTVVAMIKTYKPYADAYTQSTTGLDLSNKSKTGLIL